MKLCNVGIHKWIHSQPFITHLKYRTCRVCGKHQVKEDKAYCQEYRFGGQ